MASFTVTSTLDPLYRLAGWYLLPRFFSGLLLRVFYSIKPSSRLVVPPLPSPPAPGQPRILDPATHRRLVIAEKARQTHVKWSYFIVIVGYLVYTIVAGYLMQGRQGNYYSVLGLKPTSMVDSALPQPGTPSGATAISTANHGIMDETALRSYWKRVVKLSHPDKLPHLVPPEIRALGSTAEAQWTAMKEQEFVAMRGAYEVLSDPVKRWAYDRFGPEVKEWTKSCKTPREWMAMGTKRLFAPTYLSGVVGLGSLRLFRGREPGSFWRWIILLATALAEIRLLIQPSSLPPTILSSLFPNRALYECLALLRTLSLAASCAVTQLAPLFFPPPPSLEQEAMELNAEVQRLMAMDAILESELRALKLEDLRPLLMDDEGKPIEQEEGSRAVMEVQEQMLDILCDRTLLNSAEGRAVWQAALVRASKLSKPASPPSPGTEPEPVVKKEEEDGEDARAVYAKEESEGGTVIPHGGDKPCTDGEQREPRTGEQDSQDEPAEESECAELNKPGGGMADQEEAPPPEAQQEEDKTAEDAAVPDTPTETGDALDAPAAGEGLIPESSPM